MRFALILGAFLLIPSIGIANEEPINDTDCPARTFSVEPATSPAATSKPDSLQTTDKVRMEQSFGRLPLYFIENQGQLDEEVAYYVQGTDKTLYFTSEGITLALTGQDGHEAERWAVKLDFVGANPHVKPRGENKQKAIFSYFKGTRENWKPGVPTYSKLLYEDLWPGIDLVYSGIVNNLKYEFIVRPGADPDDIRMAYRGATELSVQETGNLKVSTAAGDFEDGIPLAYQPSAGGRKEVTLSYSLLEMTGNDALVYGFDVGEYDPHLPLILDPVLIVYCGFVGGAWDDAGVSIAVDDLGCTYITGLTQFGNWGFPVAVGPDLTFNGDIDAFVTKINSAGNGIVYSGFIGGAMNDYGNGIAVDGSGCAYLAGTTHSDEGSFPVIVGPDLTYNGIDAYVAKVNSEGTELIYCGYIGGHMSETGDGIAVDESGCAYVTGNTMSDEASFPVMVGPDLTYNGAGGGYLLQGDAFVAKVNASGSRLIYCGYIGGEVGDGGKDIAVDRSGCAYVTGDTMSDEESFPVMVGPDLTFNSLSGPYDAIDAFVAKVNSRGTGLLYCGYIGGALLDNASGIAVDP